MFFSPNYLRGWHGGTPQSNSELYWFGGGGYRRQSPRRIFWLTFPSQAVWDPQSNRQLYWFRRGLGPTGLPIPIGVKESRQHINIGQDHQFKSPGVLETVVLNKPIKKPKNP